MRSTQFIEAVEGIVQQETRRFFAEIARTLTRPSEKRTPAKDPMKVEAGLMGAAVRWRGHVVDGNHRLAARDLNGHRVVLRSRALVR